jgi:capsular polysaccharide biosynthesis protein/Mrp family chromosome partitioning ATPase
MDALARDIGGNDSLRSIGRIRRYWWLVLLGALLGLLAGAMATTVVSKQYTATTTVNVSGIPDATTLTGGRTNSSVNMDNELQYLESIDVIRGAEKLLRITPSTTEDANLALQVSATVPPNTTFMQISFVGATPDKSVQGAEAFAQSYLTARAAYVHGLIQAQSDDLTKTLAADTTALNNYAARAATLPKTSPEYVSAQSYVSIYTGGIHDTNQALATIKTLDISPVTVITPPIAPTSPSKPVPPLYVGTGIFAGLVLGLGLAVLAARLDKRVRYPQDVEERIGRPVLASVPRGSRGKLPGGLLTARTGSGEFDRLRLRLEAAMLDRSDSVLVCADHATNGTSFVAANLAASLARSGTPVVVISTDPESRLAETVGVREAPGLAQALLEERPLDDVAQTIPGRPRMQVVVPGRDLADVLDRVPLQRVAALVDEIVRSGRHVVLEASPVSYGTEAQELSRRMGTALVVVDLGVSKVPDVRSAFDEIELVGAFAPGAVVVPQVTTMPRVPLQGEPTSESSAQPTLP